MSVYNVRANASKSEFLQYLLGDSLVVPGIVVGILRLNPGAIIRDILSLKGSDLLPRAKRRILSAPQEPKNVLAVLPVK